MRAPKSPANSRYTASCRGAPKHAPDTVGTRTNIHLPHRPYMRALVGVQTHVVRSIDPIVSFNYMYNKQYMRDENTRNIFSN